MASQFAQAVEVARRSPMLRSQSTEDAGSEAGEEPVLGMVDMGEAFRSLDRKAFAVSDVLSNEATYRAPGAPIGHPARRSRTRGTSTSPAPGSPSCSAGSF